MYIFSLSIQVDRLALNLLDSFIISSMVYILHQKNILKGKDRSYKLKVSFLQIHNDKIYNLIDSTTGELKICEDESGRNFVKDLKVTSLKFIDIVFLALHVHFIFYSPFINQEFKVREIERQRSVDPRVGRVLLFIEQRKGGC